MRRPPPLALLSLSLLLLLPIVGCTSTRDRAHDDLVDQLVDDGGLERSVAECVVDGFFGSRSTDELKEFFKREGLTVAEQQEFAQLGDACATTPATS